jgi:hypothetical protein
MAEELVEMCRRLRLSESEKNNVRLRTAKIQHSKNVAKFSCYSGSLPLVLLMGMPLKER